MVSSPLFLSPSDDLHGPPFQRSSASAIEYMDSYEENKKRKDGAKIPPSLRSAQRRRSKLRLAPFIDCRVLSCAASKTTLIFRRRILFTSLRKFDSDNQTF